MFHLSSDEVVTLLDGELPKARAAHADECAMCRQQIAELRAALREALISDVPEPSPLFWDHFSARIRDTIVENDSGRSSSWARWRVSRVGMAAAALVGAVALVIATLVRSPSVQPDGRPGASVSAPTDDRLAIETSADSEVEWTVVSAVAQQLDWDSMNQDFHIAPGAADLAAQELSADERKELARLLAAELGSQL